MAKSQSWTDFARGTALAAAFVVGGAAGAFAQSGLLDATDPDALASVVSGYGSVEMETDSHGDPVIRGRIDGTRYSIYFYGCTDGRDCGFVQFRTAYSGTGANADTVASWNREKVFGKAYLDEEGDPVLELPVNLFGGVSRDNWDDTVDWWKVIMDQFEDWIGYN